MNHMTYNLSACMFVWKNSAGKTCFNLVGQTEPEQCVHRLICDLATGQMPPSSDDIIMRLFEDTKAVPQASPVFDFAVAAEIGKLVKDVQKCEIQYTCPMTGAQLQKMLVQ